MLNFIRAFLRKIRRKKVVEDKFFYWGVKAPFPVPILSVEKINPTKSIPEKNHENYGLNIQIRKIKKREVGHKW